MPENQPLIARHSLLSLAVLIGLCSGPALAQSAFPALPGESRPAANNSSAFPPIGGRPAAPAAAPTAFPSTGAPAFGGGGGGFQPPAMAAPQGGPPDNCMKEFIPLREEAERRGKLIGNFGKAEVKMIKYVEAHAASCGIPQQIAEQLKTGHKGTEALEKKVCAVAAQMQTRGSPAAPSLSDVLGSSAALPEANTGKKGGSAFDTMTGNVLTR